MFKSNVVKLITIFTTVFSSSAVFAGVPNIGTMTMNFGGTSVPSLSGMMLIVLSLLLFAIAFHSAKQKQGNKLFVTLIGSGALLAVVGGTGQLKNSLDAQAVSWNPILFTNQPGGNTQPLLPGTNNYTNNESVLTARISINVNTNEGYVCEGPTNDENVCREGAIVNPGQSCYLNCFNINMDGN